MKQLRVFLYILKNKYIVATTVFFVWIIVFDKNNLLSQIDLANKLHQLKEDKKYYIDQIKQDEMDVIKLTNKNNTDDLEKFAREKYLMKRDSEDIFLIVRPDTIQKKLK